MQRPLEAFDQSTQFRHEEKGKVNDHEGVYMKITGLRESGFTTFGRCQIPHVIGIRSSEPELGWDALQAIWGAGSS